MQVRVSETDELIFKTVFLTLRLKYEVKLLSIKIYNLIFVFTRML